MTRILTISDSFKGTMSSNEVGKTISDYYLNKGYDASYLPISDGGEGFLDVIEHITKLSKQQLLVKDAYFNSTNAKYIIDEKNNTAYLELAEPSGIAKLDKSKLRAPYASTYGLGELLKYILQNYKIKKVILGIGGSATSDLGCGMLEAMGVEFLDKDGFVIRNMCNANLMRVRKFNLGSFKKIIRKVKFITLTDVDNPLLGKNGSINVFARQKGATEEDLFAMERNMLHIYNVIRTTHKKMPKDFKKAGAAGGVGYAMKAFFNSEIESGINTILKLSNLEEKVNNYDIIFTGEGSLDSQSLNGKVISGIMKTNPKRLIIVCGQNKLENTKYEVYSLTPNVVTLDEALSEPVKSLIKLLGEIKI